MKSYQISKIDSQNSPLYNVIVEENDGTTFAWQLAIKDENNIDAEVKAAYSRIKNPAQPKTPGYKEKRQGEYPLIEDYLDGIVKNDQQQIQSYIQACLAVKAKYPKE